jgi:hypothetical protein
MTICVCRYPVHIVGMQTILVHPPVRILSVGLSRSNPNEVVMWGMGDDAAPPVPINVYIVGTGHIMPNAVLAGTSVFRGTVVTPNQMAWHVWTGPKL